MSIPYVTIAKLVLGSYRPGMIPVIYGQTATGKTRLSLELAEHLPIEVVSADSRQIYRYMNIGTDKVSEEIREQIPHHQIDIINPDEIYTAGQWQQDVYQIILHIFKRGNIPVIVGGTGLYIDTIVYNFNMGIVKADYGFRKQMEQEELSNPGLLWRKLNDVDPVEALKHHPSSIRFIIRALEIYHHTGIPKSNLMKKQTPKHPLLMIGLRHDTQIGNQFIDQRLQQMIQAGLVEEVKHILDTGYDPHCNALQSIDYKQTIGYLRGDYGWDEYIRLLQIANHQLAKRQRTWFRRYARDQKHAQQEGGDPMITYQSFYLPDYI